MADSKQIPRDMLVGNLRSRYTWRKVERPMPWKPRLEGDELIGFYGGKTIRNGKFGQYEVAIVHVPNAGSFMLSGVAAIQSFDTANLDIGWPVKVIWKGMRDLGQDKESGKKKEMKLFDVYVAEGDPIAAGELPALAPEPPAGPQ